MRDYFVTYEIAKLLSELNFDENCIGYFDNQKRFDLSDPICNSSYQSYSGSKGCIAAPLWSQVIDLLRSKGIHLESHYFGGDTYQFKICEDFGERIWVGENEMLYLKAKEQAILKALTLIK